jgi:squalene synthase HpnC
MMAAWDVITQLRRWGPQVLPYRKTPTLAQARAYCRWLTRNHYENFSVVSWWLPRRLHPHVEAIYAYCRWADDLADETHPGHEALSLLQWWREELLRCYEGQCRHPVFVALQPTLHRFAIPPEPFLRLLEAFVLDQQQVRYRDFATLLHYCQRSANPVGHLVLYLFDSYDSRRAALADEICTGLQLANFWQDVSRDWERGRIYLPAEDCARFGYTEADFQARRCNNAFRELLRFQVERARGFLNRGAELLPLLPAEALMPVELFLQGGRAILQAIERQQYDVWTSRPIVSSPMKCFLLGWVLGRHIWRQATGIGKR